MTPRSFANLLAPLGWLVLVGGWVIAVVAFLVIGTQSCATVQVAVANVEVCQDTTSQAVVLLAVIGFAATVGSLFLWALRYLLALLDDIESNTRAGGK